MLLALKQIAPLTAYSAKTLYRLKNQHKSFPKPTSTIKICSTTCALYNSDDVVSWARSYNERGKQKSQTIELQTLEQIAPLTPYTYNSLSYLRSTAPNFPRPKGRVRCKTIDAHGYEPQVIIEWANAYKVAPRGKKGSVVVESAGVFDDKMARWFICRPLINTGGL